MSINASAIFFDLDGTLIHSAPDLQAAANTVCTRRNWEAFDVQTITSFVGNGIPKLVERVFKARNQSIESADFQAALEEFRAYYDAHSSDLTELYPGVHQALESLAGLNMPMAMITNKPKAPAIDILAALGIADFFTCVIGGDSTPFKKPDPAPYMAACEEMGVKPDQTIYVGDSETDGKTAANVKVRFALFSGGYRTTPVSKIPHNVLVDDLNNLPTLLQSI